MAAEFTRGDAIREYLTGAASDGGAQPDQALSLGNRRSSTEVVCLGISLANAINNVYVDYASGGNPAGSGQLRSLDGLSLSWKPPGASDFGEPQAFSGAGVKGTVEANGQAGRFLRVTVTTPFDTGTATVTLSVLYNNVYGFSDVSVADAAAGVNQYRATITKNVSPAQVQGLKRWIGLLGTVQTASTGLPSGGTGTVATAGTFADWPAYGWCQVRTSVGTLREVVYYSSRTNAVLTVPSGGRSLLGTTAAAGSAGDLVYPVPGIAIAKAAEGVQAGGSAIQLVAGENAAPTGVTWNLGIDEATGLDIGTLLPSEQIGMWVWRAIPPGARSTANMLARVVQTFNTY